MQKINMNQEDNRLFWIKYRPKNLEDVAIPSRVRNILNMEFNTNLVFYGTFGLGKTTVAEALLADYYEYRIDGKIGVDELRNGITRFCKTVPNSLGKNGKKNNVKVVFIDEFDNATSQVQGEMKAFIEKFSNVRFVFTCNELSKVEGALDSRFTRVNFNCLNADEHNEVKSQIYTRLKKLNKEENWNVPADILKDCIFKSYPDFRKTMQDIQLYVESDGLVRLESIILVEDFFNLVLENSSSEQIWDYLRYNWASRVSDAFKMFSQHFFTWIRMNHPDRISNLPEAMDIISEYGDIRLPYAVDPLNTLNCAIYKVQQVMQPEN